MEIVAVGVLIAIALVQAGWSWRRRRTAARARRPWRPIPRPTVDVAPIVRPPGLLVDLPRIEAAERTDDAGTGDRVVPLWTRDARRATRGPTPTGRA